MFKIFYKLLIFLKKFKKLILTDVLACIIISREKNNLELVGIKSIGNIWCKLIFSYKHVADTMVFLSKNKSEKSENEVLKKDPHTRG